MPIQRAVVTLDTSRQLDLIPGEETTSPEVERHEPTVGVKFKRPDLRELFVCGVRLDAYLSEMGSGDALAIRELRELLHKQEWELFKARYQAGGRSP